MNFFFHELAPRHYTQEVAADGNCFFRAMCDQRSGSEEGHMRLRNEVVDYMVGRRRCKLDPSLKAHPVSKFDC